MSEGYLDRAVALLLNVHRLRREASCSRFVGFMLCSLDTSSIPPASPTPLSAAATPPPLPAVYASVDGTGPVDLLMIAMAIVIGLPLFRLWLYHVHTILGKGQTTNEDMRREIRVGAAAVATACFICLFVFTC